MKADDPGLFTTVTVLSLLACAAQLVLGYILAQIWGRKCSVTDRWVLVWLFYDAIVHTTLVSGCVWCSAEQVISQRGDDPQLCACVLRKGRLFTCHWLELLPNQRVYLPSCVSILKHMLFISPLHILFLFVVAHSIPIFFIYLSFCIVLSRSKPIQIDSVLVA